MTLQFRLENNARIYKTITRVWIINASILFKVSRKFKCFSILTFNDVSRCLSRRTSRDKWNLAAYNALTLILPKVLPLLFAWRANLHNRNPTRNRSIIVIHKCFSNQTSTKQCITCGSPQQELQVELINHHNSEVFRQPNKQKAVYNMRFATDILSHLHVDDCRCTDMD